MSSGRSSRTVGRNVFPVQRAIIGVSSPGQTGLWNGLDAALGRVRGWGSARGEAMGHHE